MMERQDIRQQLLAKGVDDEVVSDILSKIRARRVNGTSNPSKKTATSVTPKSFDGFSSLPSTSQETSNEVVSDVLTKIRTRRMNGTRNDLKNIPVPVTPDSSDDECLSLPSPPQESAIPLSQIISFPLSPVRDTSESEGHALKLGKTDNLQEEKCHVIPTECRQSSRSKPTLTRFNKRSPSISSPSPQSYLRELEQYNVEFLSDSVIPGELSTKRNRFQGEKYTIKYEMVPYFEPKRTFVPKHSRFDEFDDNATVATEATDLTAVPDSFKDIFASRILEDKPKSNSFDFFNFNEHALEEVLKIYFCNASISDVEEKNSTHPISTSETKETGMNHVKPDGAASPLNVKEKTRVKMFLASRIDQLRKNIKINKSPAGKLNEKSSRSLEKAMMAQLERITKSKTSQVTNEELNSNSPPKETKGILKAPTKDRRQEQVDDPMSEEATVLMDETRCNNKPFCNASGCINCQTDMLCGCPNIYDMIPVHFGKTGKNKVDTHCKVGTTEASYDTLQPANETKIKINYDKEDDDFFEEFEIFRKGDGKSTSRGAQFGKSPRTFMIEDKLHTEKGPRFLLRGRFNKEANQDNISAGSLAPPDVKRETRLKKIFSRNNLSLITATANFEEYDGDSSEVMKQKDKDIEEKSIDDRKKVKSKDESSPVWNVLDGKIDGVAAGTASNRSIEMTTENGTKTIHCTPDEEPLEHSNLANNLAVLLMTAHETPLSSPARVRFEDDHQVTDFSALVSPSSYDTYLSPSHSLSFDSAQTYDAGDCFVTENFVQDTLTDATSVVSGKFNQAVVGIDTGTSSLFSTNATIDDMWLAKVVLTRYATSNGMTVDELIEDVCDKLDALDKTVFRVK